MTVLQIPILLAEMSPPAFRATFPGVAYQLGNMVSSASAQIEATGGDHLKTTLIINGKPTVVPDYATVQGILIGVVAIFVICVTILAPEYVFSISPSPSPNKHMDRNHSSHFEQAKAAFEEGAGEDEMEEEGAPETEKIGGEKGSIERESVVIESTVWSWILLSFEYPYTFLVYPCRISCVYKRHFDLADCITSGVGVVYDNESILTSHDESSWSWVHRVQLWFQSIVIGLRYQE